MRQGKRTCVVLDPVSAGASDGRDWLALCCGRLRASVATIVASFQFMRDRAAVKLVLTPISSETEGSSGSPAEVWGIRVVNHRKRPITIRDAGLLRGKDHLHCLFLNIHGDRIADPFPVALTDGMSAEFYVHRDDRADVRGAWVRDARDRTYKVRYSSRSPWARLRAWRINRRADKLIKEREERVAALRRGA